MFDLPFIAPHHIRLASLERRIAVARYSHGARKHLLARYRFLKAVCAAKGA